MESRTSPSARLVLAIVCLGVFSTALDQTVVVTALPSVMLDIKIPLAEIDQASWIITGYLLGYTVAMPLVGRISDIYGYPRIYQASLVLFSIGSLMVALASSLPEMVTARVIQAVGGGATVPISMAIASSVMPPGRRALAVGLVGAAAEAGSVLGPLYGGAIIHLLSWRWIFWLDIPQSALLIAALALLTNQRRGEGRIDFLGGILLAGALTALTLSLSMRDAFTGASPTPYLLIVLGVFLVGVLALVERRTWQPLLAPFLFRSLSFLTANASQLLVGVALIIGMVNVPLMANTIMAKEPLEGGLQLMRLTAAIPVGAIAGGYILSGGSLLRLLGAREVMVIGLGLVALGCYFMSGWEIDVDEPWLTLHLITCGLGFGLVIAPIMATSLNAVTEDYWGTAASLVTVSRMVGMALGLAALSAWGVEHFHGLTAGLDLPLPLDGESAQALQLRQQEYQSAVSEAALTLFQDFFRVAAVMALVAIVPALGMKLARR